MLREELVNAQEFCLHNQVEISFINTLSEYGLIEIKTIEEQPFLETGKLQLLEKMIRLHYDLHINVEGLDAINCLLERVENLQQEVNVLRSRLSAFDY
ncbi:MerR family transcriptional regulator [Segetibacter sp. 3557_3]|uniref:chaperone modulator CbpM n=1 Tax=Segetibacter sp. 3557_3 TaxID=2547429 RepID=UPI00105919D8|nr:chaperone modulator CbpM [Segetibacter sp. 3557_3]TDH24221.1 MerR family transcriptional regulator [Segetibacter sp. 3557_3]